MEHIEEFIQRHDYSMKMSLIGGFKQDKLYSARIYDDYGKEVHVKRKKGEDMPRFATMELAAEYAVNKAIEEQDNA